jgi:hypothetical protein
MEKRVPVLMLMLMLHLQFGAAVAS